MNTQREKNIDHYCEKLYRIFWQIISDQIDQNLIDQADVKTLNLERGLVCLLNCADRIVFQAASSTHETADSPSSKFGIRSQP